MSTAPQVRALRVLHVGAGRYSPGDTSHSTFSIWRQLASGFSRYTVVGRSIEGRSATMVEGSLRVELLPSRLASEAEFLLSQQLAVHVGRDERPDVVVAQCPVLGGLAAAQLARQQGCRVLMELHGWHYFDQSPPLGHRLVVQLAKLNLRNADRIRVLSNRMSSLLLERFGHHYKDRVVVLPPRVDLSTFSHPKGSYSIGPRALRVVMVGGVNENKGQLRFLQTALSLSSAPEVWIIGSGPQLAACQSYAEEQAALDRVKFFGTLTHAQLARVLPEADLLVQFSRAEATPRAILEAMACGLPVLATDVGFCADLVDHGVTGFLLQSGSPEEVGEYLERIEGSELLRETMGRTARLRVQRDFDADVLYTRYRDLISETADA